MNKNNIFGVTNSKVAGLQEGLVYPMTGKDSNTDQIVNKVFEEDNSMDFTGYDLDAGVDIKGSVGRINKEFESGENGRTGIAKIMFEKEYDVSKWPTIGDYTYIESFIRMLTETGNDINDNDLVNIMKYFYRRK